MTLLLPDGFCLGVSLDVGIICLRWGFTHQQLLFMVSTVLQFFVVLQTSPLDSAFFSLINQPLSHIGFKMNQPSHLWIISHVAGPFEYHSIEKLWIGGLFSSCLMLLFCFIAVKIRPQRAWRNHMYITGQLIKMITVNGWCAGGMGWVGVGKWRDECSVNGRDGERLLSKLSPTSSWNHWQKEL